MRPWIICLLTACGAGAEVATVEVAPSTVTLSPLDTAQLTAVARDHSGHPVAGAAVSWASSDPAIATVADGVVQAVAPGTAAITASADGATGQIDAVVRNAPAVRWGHALVHDAARGTTILFGGSTAGSTGAIFHGDTWTWDGAGWQRSTVTGPAPRDQHVMAYDSARRRVVLFGGRLADNTKATDTWEWDGAAWTQRASSGPPAREHHAGGYDAARARFVVHGGQSASGALADTWAWDGASWTQVSSTVPAPRELPSRGMAFSAPRGTLLMAIGNLITGQSELWEWNGATWAAVGGGQLDAESPLPLVETAIPGEALAVNESPAGGIAQTWRWAGGQWTRVATAGPPARFISAMAFDATRNEVILFGGTSPDGKRFFGDTWTWDGGAWRAR